MRSIDSNSVQNLVIETKKQTIASDNEDIRQVQLFEKSGAIKLAARTLDVVSDNEPVSSPT